MELSIVPLAASASSTDDLVIGFPGLGAVKIQGLARIANRSHVRVAVRYLSVDLSGSTFGDGGNGSTTDLSLIHGKRILFESKHNTDLPIDSGAVVDLPFLFDLQQEYASVLPPSFDTSGLLSIGCHTQYSVQALLRCDLDPGTVHASVSFRLPRFDILELKQVLSKQSFTLHSRVNTSFTSKPQPNNNNAAPDPSSSLDYTIISPKAIVPSDRFLVSVSARCVALRITRVRIDLMESVRISNVATGARADTSEIVYSWDSSSAGIPPSHVYQDENRELTAPNLYCGRMGTAVQRLMRGVNPSSVSGGIEVSHRLVYNIRLENFSSPIVAESAVSVLPATPPQIEDLLADSHTFLSSSDPAVASFARFLSDYKSGRLAAMQPESLLGDEEALERAIALSMQDDMARALRDSEETFNPTTVQPPNMDEEEMIRIAIAQSMGLSPSSSHALPTTQGRLGGSSSYSPTATPSSLATTIPSNSNASSLPNALSSPPSLSPTAPPGSGRSTSASRSSRRESRDHPPRRATITDRRIHILRDLADSDDAALALAARSRNVRPSASTATPHMRIAGVAHVPAEADEMRIDLGDVVVVIDIFLDDWAEGFNVTSNAAGRFPMFTLSTTIMPPIVPSPSDVGPIGLVSLRRVEEIEDDLDERLIDGLISPQGFLAEREGLLRILVN